MKAKASQLWKDEDGLEGLVREVLGTKSGAPPRLASSDGIAGRLISMASRDYLREVDRFFSRRELRKLFRILEASIVEFNKQRFRTKPNEFSRIAEEFGAQFKATPYRDSDGIGPLGFYVNDRGTLKRPLICLNSAHHPVAMGSAFWHELGHHICSQIFGRNREAVTLQFGEDFDDHLSEPLELAADMLVSVAAYPRDVAKRLFSQSAAESAPNAGATFSELREHLRSGWGFDFSTRAGTPENLVYLAGMIHYAKLRSALLTGYDT